jgi:hypothetical protein
MPQVVQDLPLLNAGSDAPLSATATLTGKGFSGAREVSVQAKADGRWVLVACVCTALHTLASSQSCMLLCKCQAEVELAMQA